MRNPNGPPEVRPLEPAALAALQSDRELLIVDTRSAQERAIAALPLAHDVLDESSFERLSALPKDRPIAFLCHHGVSSRRAAEHFRSLGFREVYNIEGGIEAYARDVDASVARY